MPQVRCLHRRPLGHSRRYHPRDVGQSHIFGSSLPFRYVRGRVSRRRRRTDR